MKTSYIYSLVVAFLLSLCVSAGAVPILDNPGFEKTDGDGKLQGWQVYAGLDPNGYSVPDFKVTFDEVVPLQASGGHGGSGYCAGYPREGVWMGKIVGHLDPGGKGGVDGRKFGKAALSQTITLDPGTYVFGAYLRTADGGGYTSAFSFGFNHGQPVSYANDNSTGITWTSPDLGLKTSFDNVGYLKERGEWYKYQTEPFEVKKRGPVTVWIRLNYVNNNSMPTRWQVDDAFIAPYKADEPGERTITVKPTAGAPLRYPLPGMLVADCGDDSEQYLKSGEGSTLRDKIHKRIFQHAKCVTGNASFTYEFPIDPKQDVVYVAFEHLGPCKVTMGGSVVRTDSGAVDEQLNAKEYVLTDRQLWKNGKLSVKFESALKDKQLAVLWIEAGVTTRFRERFKYIEWDTVSIPWRIGLWDAESSEFRGTDRNCIIGETNYNTLNNKDIRIEWTQKVKPGHRYYMMLGYYKSQPDETRGQIDIGDDGTVEMISKIQGHEVLEYDITEYLADGKNVASVKAQTIDFVALVEVLPGVTDNRKLNLYFGGDEMAENFTRVLHNSMFWILNMHYDYTGFVDASIPRGKWWNQYWPIDIGMALRSMLYWGYLDQAENAAKFVGKKSWEGHESNSSGGWDNTGGNILATDMLEIILRRNFEPEITDALWPILVTYCEKVCNDVDKSPFGMIKGTNWENAGNLKQGSCYAISTNLLVSWYLQKAADVADEGNLNGDAKRWRETGKRIRSEVLNRLVFKEDTKSPTGWVFPKGTWAYGLLDDGSYMYQPLAGYLWAGRMITSYSGFLDNDEELRSIYSKTEDAALPLVGGPGGVVSGYASSYDGEQTLLSSAALSDKIYYMDKLIGHLKGQVDYEHDKGSPIAELSRWAYGQPGWCEDTNLVCVAEFLDWPRYLIGVDDILFKGVQLRIIPRLPSCWNECGINDWMVQYLNDDKRAITSLSYNYMITDNSAVMRISTKDPVKGMHVRVGPFAEDAKVKQVTLDLKPVAAKPEISGGKLWLWVVLDTDSRERVLKAAL